MWQKSILQNIDVFKNVQVDKCKVIYKSYMANWIIALYGAIFHWNVVHWVDNKVWYEV